MIGRRDFRRAWASLLMLFLLLATLGALQTKWLSEASRAQRERVLSSMQGAAERFATDFDREVSRLYLALQSDRRASELTAASLAAHLDRWQVGATTPTLLRDLVLLRRQGQVLSAARLDRDLVRLIPMENDAELEEIRSLARSWIEARALGFPDVGKGATGSPILPTVPGLLIPRFDLGATRAERSMQDAPPTDLTDLIIVRLSREAISRDLLPYLEELHFPSPLWEGYEIDVVDADGYVLGATSDASPLSPESDVEQAILGLLPREQLFRLAGDLQSDLAPSDLGPRKPRGEDSMRRTRHFMPPFSVGGHGHDSSSGWRLLVRHPEGSLDAAVKRAYHRNLAVSFAVLALLAASAMALLVSVRRNQMLADRQMQFVAGVSHELRTPVAGIRSLAQNLADGVVSEPKKVREYGRSIEADAGRLADMVEQVLARAGMHSRQTESLSTEIDVRAALELAVADSEQRLEAESAEVDITVPESLPSLEGNPTALRRALRNLIENAATHGGPGSISVRAESSCDRGREQIRLVVEDSGPGIHEDELGEVFEPFFRGQRARQQQSVGSGLGLSLVAEIASLHGGHVTVVNRPTGGAIFTLHLPAGHRRTESTEKAEKP